MKSVGAKFCKIKIAYFNKIRGLKAIKTIHKN